MILVKPWKFLNLILPWRFLNPSPERITTRWFSENLSLLPSQSQMEMIQVVKIIENLGCHLQIWSSGGPGKKQRENVSVIWITPPNHHRDLQRNLIFGPTLRTER
jgi:hypothetical protein